MSVTVELMQEGTASAEISSLSSERRALFEAMYKEQTGDLPLLQIPLITRPWTAPYPMAPNQERLWLVQSARPNVPLFNNPLLATMQGPCVLSHLQASLDFFVLRHEALRYRFQAGEKFAQVVPAASHHVPLKEVDLSAVSAAEIDALVEKMAHEEALISFNLPQGDLIRATLFRCADKTVLLLNAHHIVCDGWSGVIFQREFPAIYAALAAGKTPDLPPVKHHYHEYAIWQRQWLQGLEARRQIAFWRQNLHGIESHARLPRCYKDVERRSYVGRTATLAIARPVMEAALAAARAQRTSLFVYCLAAFKHFLAELTAQTDIVVGTPNAGRGRPELDSMYGYLVNKQVLRTNLAGAADFAEVLQRVKQSFGSAFENQDAPILEVIRAVCPGQESVPDPLYQIVFTVSDLSDDAAMKQDAVDADTLSFTAMRGLPITMAEFELNVAIHPHQGDYRMHFFYSSEIFSETVVQQWMQAYLAVLRRCVGLMAKD